MQNRLRKHFGKCINKGIISPFPSFAILRQKDVYSLDTVPIYCECRCPDDGKQMIECEKCKEWFHATCVTIKSAKNYKCTFCLNTVKDSSWICLQNFFSPLRSHADEQLNVPFKCQFRFILLAYVWNCKHTKFQINVSCLIA